MPKNIWDKIIQLFKPDARGLPLPARRLTVYNHILPSNDFGYYGNIKRDKACNALAMVLNHPLFRDKVVNFSDYRFLPGEEKLSGNQILEKIMKGNEHHGDINSGGVDLFLFIKEESNSTEKGYGNNGDSMIFTYRNWFDAFTPLEYAAHIAHEWCHKLGFTHSDDPGEPHLTLYVPYVIHDFVLDVGNYLSLDDDVFLTAADTGDRTENKALIMKYPA